MTLAPAGQDFQSHAIAAPTSLANAERAASDLRNKRSGHLCVAAAQMPAAKLLPAVIENFSQVWPQVHVKVQDTAVDQLISAVVHSECDLAMGTDGSLTELVERIDLFDSP